MTPSSVRRRSNNDGSIGEKVLQTLVKLIFVIALIPVVINLLLQLIGVGVQLLGVWLSMLALWLSAMLPWIVAGVALFGITTGLMAGLMVRRRLPPRNTRQLPPLGHYSPVRRPRSRRNHVSDE